MVTSTLPNTSSERNTVTHHVSTIVALHRFKMLVANGRLNIAQYLIKRNTVTHHVRYGTLNIKKSNTPKGMCLQEACFDEYN